MNYCSSRCYPQINAGSNAETAQQLNFTFIQHQLVKLEKKMEKTLQKSHEL